MSGGTGAGRGGPGHGGQDPWAGPRLSPRGLQHYQQGERHHSNITGLLWVWWSLFAVINMSHTNLPTVLRSTIHYKL